jgi:hypothetical protein
MKTFEEVMDCLETNNQYPALVQDKNYNNSSYVMVSSDDEFLTKENFRYEQRQGVFTEEEMSKFFQQSMSSLVEEDIKAFAEASREKRLHEATFFDGNSYVLILFIDL